MVASRNLLFMTTWHPATLTRGDSKAKVTRSFYLHVQKAVEIALGQRPDAPPRIIENPTAAEAEKVFRKWKEEGFAVDIETPSLSDHKIISLAVSGAWDLAMVWDMELPSTKRRLNPLRKYLKNGVRKVFQNGEFDITILEKNGFEINRESCWDTMIENSILFPDEPVNLSFLTSLVTDVEAWKHLRGDRILFYNALDACHDWRVYVTSEDYYQEYER